MPAEAMRIESDNLLQLLVDMIRTMGRGVRRHTHELILVFERHHPHQESCQRIEFGYGFRIRHRCDTLKLASAPNTDAGTDVITRAIVGENEDRLLHPAPAIVRRR